MTPTRLAITCEVPRAFAMPRPADAPHPLAAAAAAMLASELEATPRDVDWFAPGAGKMFGVLVVADDRGDVGFLRAFSGMIGGRWVVDGFAPPLFDIAARDAFWPAGEAELVEMTRAIAQSSGAARRALELRRRARSRELWSRLQRTYRIANVRGDVRTLDELFAPAVPPSGAGDCAGPKLVGHAHRLGVRPLALAEIWWGAPTGDRVHRSFHAPCDRKCGPVLAHMLRGL